MTGIYRCLGCADGIVVLDHHCAGARELEPTGGTCQCTRPGCGPNPNGQQLRSVGKPTRKA